MDKGDRRNFYSPLVNILPQAHVATTPKELLHHLGTYIFTIGNIVTSTPMFIEEYEATTYSVESFKVSFGIVNQLVQRFEDLSAFIGLRTHAYKLVFWHEAPPFW